MSQTPQRHDDHGHTPAAWTAVTIMIIGSAVGGVGIIATGGGVWLWTGVAVAIAVVGLIVGKLMQAAGLGRKVRAAVTAATDDSPAETAKAG
ncbi:HGxxPAAW family protein [Allonocardiopsis opalescens]|uniref:Uncharacterized protein n=1 Tax=Allonocardiopsis opalescens TaxID=1144618 RepID=A0A2T0Q3Z5_9ACTN|nr:HGxxPAAW family protein [Allonocardiopsis opalescens]PRX98524.1 hypothetical protein CLV72_104101 [Allonocardiopsis opalescens]